MTSTYDIDYGKYTFLLPDYYAACEYWFGHIENPVGLLQDQEVFCWLFRRYDKLDCLRSPHLYKEHAIRQNVACNKCEDRAEDIRKWFTTNAIYTSTHDLISKILQFDVDGDKSLVVADPLFVEIAERNMTNIVPLYQPYMLNPYYGENKVLQENPVDIYISSSWIDDGNWMWDIVDQAFAGMIKSDGSILLAFDESITLKHHLKTLKQLINEKNVENGVFEFAC